MRTVTLLSLLSPGSLSSFFDTLLRDAAPEKDLFVNDGDDDVVNDDDDDDAVVPFFLAAMVDCSTISVMYLVANDVHPSRERAKITSFSCFHSSPEIQSLPHFPESTVSPTVLTVELKHSLGRKSHYENERSNKAQIFHK